MKKTILFLCRSELTDLYVELGKRLKDRFQIEYAAYNDDDVKRMSHAGVTPGIVFTDCLREKAECFPTQEQLEELDQFILKWSDRRFSLNSAIQSDRTYAGMTYPDARTNIYRCYAIWKEYFSSRKIAYVFHEPVSLAFNQMAELNCKANGGMYLTFISAFGKFRFSYLILDAGNARCPELELHLRQIAKGEETVDDSYVDAFLQKFRNDYQILATHGRNPAPSFFSLFFRGTAHWLKQHLSSDKTPRMNDSVEYFLRRQNPNLKRSINKIDYALQIRYDQINPDEKYYYYSIHLEPEAVVLYWGDGFYTNQIKLIENIAGQLPPGTYLYVKDHPHYLYYREVEDYLRLKKIPNIRLLPPEIPGKKLIRNAEGVFSINATAGLEALLMQKEVYIFGHAFYAVCPLIHTVRNVRDLRDILYQASPWDEKKEEQLRVFLAAMLQSTHEGVTCFFSGLAQKYPVDQQENFNKISEDIVLFNNYMERSEKSE